MFRLLGGIWLGSRLMVLLWCSVWIICCMLVSEVGVVVRFGCLCELVIMLCSVVWCVG